MLEKLLLQLYIWLEDTKWMLVSILCNKRASAKIPKHILDELARCFLTDIVAYYDTPEGRKEYEAWKAAQATQTPQNAPERPTAPLNAKNSVGTATQSPPDFFVRNK